MDQQVSTAEMDIIILNRLEKISLKIHEFSLEAEQILSDSDFQENLQKAQIHATKLESFITRFNSELNQYFRTSNNPSADDVSKMSDIQLKGEEVLAELKCRLDKNKTRDYGRNERVFSAKLPTLSLPEYSGDILGFSEFWDIFKSNIHDRPIPDVDKLLYLKSTLKGEPRRIIDGLGTTNQNYSIAIQLLKDKYGKQSQTIDAHYGALNKLKRADDTTVQCRRTLNEIECHLRVLQTLGENIQHNHLRYLIKDKFPESVIYEMKLKIKEDSIDEMRKALDKIITCREESNKERPEQDSVEKETHTVETLHSTNRNSKTRSKNNFNNFRRENTFKNNFKSKFKTNFKDNFVKKEENKQRSNYSHRTSAPSTSRSNDNPNAYRKRTHEQDKGSNDIQRKKWKPSCVFCKSSHFSDQCQQYKTVEERKAKLTDECYNCLSLNHKVRSCTKHLECYHCKKKGHHRALCPIKFKSKGETTMTADSGNELTILQTAIVTVRNERDPHNSIECRLLLDSGSQRSYIKEEISRKLNLPILEENKLSIFGFASETPQVYDSPLVRLKIKTKTNKDIVLHVNEVPSISRGVVTPNIDIKDHRHKVLADDGSLGERVDILVGNDYYFNLISTNKERLKDNLFLINSELGWIVSGKISSTECTKENENTLSVVTYCQNHDPNCVYFTEPDLPLKNMDISFLWALDSIGINDNPKATREEEAVKHLNETIQYENGRYAVKWPWIQYPPDMPTNFGLAYGRLKGLLQRTNEQTVEEYQNILDEQLKNGIIEIIKPENDVYTQSVPPIHYLPHHMIKPEGKKGRIVYDASGKLKNNRSLNECMYRGPSMISDLLALLIQFRTHKIAITADVEKAFLQIGLQTEDRDVTRFLWVKDPKKPLSMDNLIHMRFCRVPFGIIASPFILTATVKHHIAQTAPELIPTVVEKCYVDNLVTGTDSVSEATKLYKTSQEIFGQLSMNMRDWTSNDEDFLKTIPSKHRAKPEEEVKVLGLKWNRKRDTLKLNIKNELFEEKQVKTPQSKRKVLSALASIYDPCGFSSPLTLPVKLLLQQLWEMKIKWDTSLPDEQQRIWEDLIQRLEMLKEIEVPRYMGIYTSTGKTSYELHGFSDASKYAYAAVIYLVAESENRKNFTFIMSKAKVTPKEERENLRMPRLELLACYLGSKLLFYVKNALGLPLASEHLWTDSQIVLSWINSNKLLPLFVERRVKVIKNNKLLKLHHISTELNPADVATRPELWEKKKTLWFHGPEFLQRKPEDWPKQPVSSLHPSSGQGPTDTNTVPMDEDGTLNMCTMDIDVGDTQETANIMKTIHKLQREYFPEECEGKKTSLAINLDVFEDIDGVLRCNGRMKNANWSFDKRHPILIPRECKFTNDLIMKIHKENYHMGPNHTLSKIREQYWIPKGKSAVQRTLKNCPECVKHHGGPFKLPSAPALPPERVNYTAPFTYTGVDYMGPVLVNNGNGKSKRWICLFTCLVVRAVHLEVVQDLTAEEGLLALRRLISSRGIPTLITSDNAQHFKLIAEIISNQYCIDKKIQWRFITPLAPWAGGFYERLIGIAKNCMKKTLDKHMLNDSQLVTVVKEIESVINSRPLTSVDSEPGHILKPSDFLTVGRVITVSESKNVMETQNTSTTKTELVKGWKRALIILKEFKDMFANQYLLSLRERYSHLPKEPRITSKLAPRPGLVVQIKGDSKNRSEWKVGKITSLIPSADGQCRAAKVQVGKSEYIRSIAHLYPLEVEDTPDPAKNGEESCPSKISILDVNDSTNCEKEDLPITSKQTTNDVPLPGTITPMELDQTPSQDETNEISSTEIIENESLPDIIESNEGISIAEPNTTGSTPIVRRAAATRAMEKIKEWARDLTALLLHSGSSPSGGSVASSANL